VPAKALMEAFAYVSCSYSLRHAARHVVVIAIMTIIIVDT
jgi:hypothetical protein